MARASEQDRMDDLLMAVSEVGHLRFVAPSECKADEGGHYRSGAEETPGVYLNGSRGGASPVAHPTFARRLLSKSEALMYAALLDRLSPPTPHMGSCGAASRTVPFPPTNVALLEAWYAALGRRLGRAIEAAEERRTSLREVRAALTGVV